MTTRAQLTQERSRLRRDELLAAAIELFAEGGSRAITHRAVAARAGLPPATTTYYFESIDELIREALGTHIDQWSRDIESLAAIDGGAGASIDDVSAFITRVFAARGPEVAGLELAIFLAAARNPGLRDNATRSMHAFEALARTVLERIGVQEPAALAASIAALIVGTAMRRQSDAYTEQAEAELLVSAIRGLVAAHTMGPESVDRTLAGLRRAQQ
ncbi:TetR family transcriptional regulator [Aeromicrobium sp. NPDC092404]|uniref:TetR/AcrR family transcriptional regulator n=1 Tax=Aeromicrobium sp. NPDC092404 TaxID=3154976 RepID=UPI00342ACAFB